MEKIIVHDNFLKNEELEQALSIINQKTWRYNSFSLYKYKYETPFWGMELTNCDFFSKYLKEVIEKTFLKKFKVIRLYANGQTYGQDGVYHTDDDNIYTYTFVLYLSNIDKEYIETAGGYIFFKLPQYNYNICYEPIYNRGILFPSHYLHKSTSFSRFIIDMRISVAWKLEEIL